MKRDTLKKKIKEKFGTHSNFARITGLDRYELQRDFLEKEGAVNPQLMLRLEELYHSAEPAPSRPVFTPEQITEIREAINEVGGVAVFSEANEYSKDTIFQILSGRMKTIGRVGQKLLIDLKIQERLLNK
jgi:hypothetical protein